MSEPLRSDPVTGASAGADQAARIEQLLLSGLDHYFAGHYDQAIHVWTRVVFLERGHSRARAYIERARSAMAERQRESEELLHRGVAAYHAGDVDAARNLLTQAVDEGGTADEALVFLQRLNRVEAAASLRPALDGTPLPRAPRAAVAQARRRSWVMPALVAAIGVGAVALGAAPLTSWILDLPGAGTAAASQPAAPEPLPLVRTADMLLIRARDLSAGGHLHDALRALERIDVGDPLRGEADRLEGEIQRALLAAVGRQAPLPEADSRP
jgi:hypothetical protein